MSGSESVTPGSLIDLLRQSIIGAISTATAPGKWRVVVADRPALKIVSSVLQMHSVLEQNVVTIQLITRSRQPYPDMDAVYILVPCADSISRVIDDFRVDSRTGEIQHRQYARAHLFFTGALSDTLLAHLRSSPAARFIKAVAELYIEYNPIESRVFLTTPSEQPFYALYSPHALNLVSRDLDAAADRLLSVIVSLGIRPYIRYYRPSPSAPYEALEPSLMSGYGTTTACPRIAESMAALIQHKLNDYYSHEQSNTNNSTKRPETLTPSVVIVLDRSVDLYSPLLREFTYQALVHDLIDLDRGNKYTYNIESTDGQPQSAEAELSEQKDPIWKQLRHWNISEVSQTLADQFEKLLKDNFGIQAAKQVGKKLTVHEMKAVLSELPEFKRLQQSYSLHIDLASKCLEIINRNSLAILSDFEQELVTGRSMNGGFVDRTSLETRLISLLDDVDIEDGDKIRLLFIYLVYANGSSESDRRRLEEVPQCLTINDKRAAVNLCRLGVPTDREEEQFEFPLSSDQYRWDTMSEPENGQMRSRLVPAVKCIINEQISDTLSTDLFPWAKEAPPESIPKNILNINATSLRQNKSSWRRKQRHTKTDAEKKGMVIVYIAGGVTLAEMRAVYELADTLKRDIYIGSTHIITPRGFLDDMKSLHLKMLL